MLFSNLTFRTFLHWSQVYSSTDNAWIKPSNDHADVILPELIPPISQHKRIMKFVANPGTGTFVVFPGTHGNRHLVMVHHFFRKEASDIESTESDGFLFAFYDVADKDCIVEVPVHLLDETSTDGTILMPTLEDLMALDSVDSWIESNQPEEDESHEATILYSMTPVPAEIMSIIIKNKGDPAKSFQHVRALLQDKLEKAELDITVIDPYKLILQTIWAASKDLIAQDTFNQANLEPSRDPVAIQIGLEKTMHFFGLPGQAQAIPPPQQQQPAINLDPFSPLHEAGLLKKKGFRSLLLCTQQMLCFVMKGKNNKTVPTEPLSDLKNLMDLTNKDMASAYLYQAFRKNKIFIVVDQKMAMNLKVLDIIAEENEVSKAYSIFLCGEKDTKRIELGKNEAEVRKQLDAQSNEQAKTKIKVPSTAADFITHLENFLGLTKFIFGPTNEITPNIYPWLEFCKDNKESLQRQAHADAGVYAKMMTIIDNKVQEFLENCRDVDSVSDIDYNILDCTSEIKGFKQKQRSQTILPPLVEAILIARSSNERNNEGSPVNVSHTKRQKTNTAAIDPTVNYTIDKQIKATYSENFHKLMPHLKEIPYWDGAQLCARYHCSGSCREGITCPRVGTHKQLPEKEVKKLKSWLDNLLGKSKKD